MIAYLPKSVLILDDSENLNDFAFLFEEKTKYKLLVKRSKYEALEAVDQNNVGVILCDIDNDTLGGVEILNDLKSHTKLIPSILLTQTPNAKLKEVGVSVGAKAWLKKPLDSEQAILVIEKILA
jgi:CheY-like chemotaxis protein